MLFSLLKNEETVVFKIPEQHTENAHQDLRKRKPQYGKAQTPYARGVSLLNLHVSRRF